VLVDAWLPRAAAKAPQAIAVNNLSYGQLLLDAQRAARQLSALGVVAGDRVAITMPAGTDFVVTFHAVLLLGAVAVPLDPRTPSAQLSARVKSARLVVDRPLDGHQDPATILVQTHDLAQVAVVLFTSGSSSAPTAVELTYGNFWWSAAGSAVSLGLDRGDRPRRFRSRQRR
jgi:O-succinylbenzoic acid--CoA ligase